MNNKLSARQIRTRSASDGRKPRLGNRRIAPLLTIVALIGSAAVSSGCASAPSAIPTGRWKGTGSCGQIAPSGPGGSRQVTYDQYKAGLTITERKLNGRDLIVLDIYSDHEGRQFADGKDVSFILVLAKPPGLPVAGGEYQAWGKLELCKNPAERQQVNEATLNEILKAKPMPNAVVTTTGNSLVLYAPYSFEKDQKGPNFAESFIFEPGGLIKTGQLSDGVERLTHWIEELRPAD